MDGIIKELVEWGRLGVGVLEIEPRPVSLATVFREFLARNAGVLAVHRLEAAIPDDLPELMADPERLERILANLVSNALKYSPPETPVRVEAERASRFVAIRVIDRGMGIGPEDRERIFDRFFRSSSSAQKTSGLGLGLFTTKRLVEAHGGEIRVESEPGKGSTFEVRLPVAG